MTHKQQLIAMALFFVCYSIPGAAISQVIHMVYTSDAHYGINRGQFQGDTNVSAHIVNAAMVKKINTIPQAILPADGGVKAGKEVGAVDYLIQTGDIANRMEIPYQSAAASWAQFELDYMDGIDLKNHLNRPVKLLLIPGNHDISNAIGSSKIMSPKTDPTAMVKMYNLMMNPSQPKTNDNYNYTTDKVHYSLNMQGIHVMFINLWPDSAERIWMQADLDAVSATTPVIVFCHDQPTCEAKHFTNPVPPYNMTTENGFENLTAERYKERKIALKGGGSTDIEQHGWVMFLKAHPNIKAYFHGNSNYNQYYIYSGPNHEVSVHTFRVDSPMKGDYSSKDEAKLSFQLLSLDPQLKLLTVRECLWNTNPSNPSSKVVFGSSKTISLKIE